MIQISDEKNNIVIDTDDADITVSPISRPVTFINEDQEELKVLFSETEGFVVEYFDNDDVLHTYTFVNGFVRRTGLKGYKKDVTDNVVPITGR